MWPSQLPITSPSFLAPSSGPQCSPKNSRCILASKRQQIERGEPSLQRNLKQKHFKQMRLVVQNYTII